MTTLACTHHFVLNGLCQGECRDCGTPYVHVPPPSNWTDRHHSGARFGGAATALKRSDQASFTDTATAIRSAEKVAGMAPGYRRGW